MIHWDTDETCWMVNPKMSQRELKALEAAKSGAPQLEGHIWIRSSGTTFSQITRWIALSKAAFLVSANAVNDHLNSQHVDIWARALPDFHVGGLAIHARAHLSGANVVIWEQPWEPVEFHRFLNDHSVTLLSLVPTQIFDLVNKGLTAPSTLRAVIVGGAELEPSIYHRARELKWPLLPSYGLTEMASQVATAPMDSLLENDFPQLKILNHVKCKVGADQQLSLKSNALFSVELRVGLTTGKVQWRARDQQAWFQTSDQVHLEDGYLQFLGRQSSMVKVLGEQVSLSRLNHLFQKELDTEVVPPGSWIIVDRKHSRKGSELCLVTESRLLILMQRAAEAFNEKVEKYERLDAIYYLKDLPKTDLGKVRSVQVKNLLK